LPPEHRLSARFAITVFCPPFAVVMQSGELQRMAFHQVHRSDSNPREYPPKSEDLSHLNHQNFGRENPIRKYCSLALLSGLIGLAFGHEHEGVPLQ
jgi:hypothetical protein